MKINVVEREFVYHGAVLADPDCRLSIEEVRSFYATQFPELATAVITGPETVGDGMPDTSKQSLLKEIREAEGRYANADPLTWLMQRWIVCQDAQGAANALARALSLQGSGEPVFPGPGIWLIPPA